MMEATDPKTVGSQAGQCPRLVPHRPIDVAVVFCSSAVHHSCQAHSSISASGPLYGPARISPQPFIARADVLRPSECPT
jgi:hypothetical protein